MIHPHEKRRSLSFPPYPARKPSFQPRIRSRSLTYIRPQGKAPGRSTAPSGVLLCEEAVSTARHIGLSFEDQDVSMSRLWRCDTLSTYQKAPTATHSLRWTDAISMEHTGWVGNDDRIKSPIIGRSSTTSETDEDPYSPAPQGDVVVALQIPRVTAGSDGASLWCSSCYEMTIRPRPNRLPLAAPTSTMRIRTASDSWPNPNPLSVS